MDQASPVQPINLTKLSDPELESLLPAVQQELATRKAKREADFFARIQEHARTLGVTPAQVRTSLAVAKPPRAGEPAAKDGRKVVKAVYRNPLNPAQTWSKRGDAPRWFVDYLASGGKLEDMLIPEGALTKKA